MSFAERYFCACCLLLLSKWQKFLPFILSYWAESALSVHSSLSAKSWCGRSSVRKTSSKKFIPCLQKTARPTLNYKCMWTLMLVETEISCAKCCRFQTAVHLHVSTGLQPSKSFDLPQHCVFISFCRFCFVEHTPPREINNLWDERERHGANWEKINVQYVS